MRLGTCLDRCGRTRASRFARVSRSDHCASMLTCLGGHSFFAHDRMHHGRGLADPLLDTALQVCPDRPVLMDAQTPLRGWYESFGFEVTGEEFLDDGIPHLPMRLRRG